MSQPDQPVVLGRYELHEEIGSGGMASVHLGRLQGAAGFSRVVAIKRLHPHLAKDRELIEMFLDEARLASRIRHPNVVPILDVAASQDELLLVMEYVPGLSLAHVIKSRARAGERIPLSMALRIMCDALQGIHAAHRAVDDDGLPLVIVHRDISPHNLQVGRDGVTRVLDFGVAKAEGRLHRTRTGRAKGKLAYMSPEQILGNPLDARSDIYSMGLTLWEALVGKRLLGGANEAELIHRNLKGDFRRPSEVVPSLPPELDDVVMRALASDPDGRFATAVDMLHELERTQLSIAAADDVRSWLSAVHGEELAETSRMLARVASASRPASDTVRRRAADAGDNSTTAVVSGARRARPSASRSLALVAALAIASVAIVAAWTALPTPRSVSSSLAAVAALVILDLQDDLRERAPMPPAAPPLVEPSAARPEPSRTPRRSAAPPRSSARPNPADSRDIDDALLGRGLVTGQR